MAKTLSYALEYREDGNAVTESIDISFVSNWARREYYEQEQIVSKLKMLYDKLQFEQDAISELLDKSNDIEKDIQPHKEKCDEIGRELEDIMKIDIFKRRFELVKEILTTNQIEEQKFYTFEFWDRCVEPQTMADFILQCVTKDITDANGKKKSIAVYR